MKSYPDYKPSHIPWLGDVPEHWEVRRLKHLAQINPSKSYGDFDRNAEELVTFLPMEKVSEDGKIDTAEKRAIKDLYAGFTYFAEGDVIVAKITPCFENGKGAYLENLGSTIGFGSTEFHVLRAKPAILPKFLYLVTRTELFKNMGEAFMTGAAGQKRVPTSFIEDFAIFLPPLNEQQTIARYLDEKTAQIDSLLYNKQQLIQLLEEEKAALINQAVTKGLNPDVPMKDSGIEWLEDVPEHWEVLKMKNICSIRQGLQIPISQRFIKKEDDCYEYITIKALNNPTEPKEYIKSPPERVICWKDDVIVARTGATGEIVTDVEGVFHNNFFLVDYDRKLIVKEFLVYFLKHTRIYEWLLLNAGTTTIPDLNHRSFYETPIFLPPIKEQEEIVENIKLELKRVSKVLEMVHKEIILIKEYRTALISEAVTGKIDLRQKASL